MTRLVLDPATVAQIRTSNRPIEVCDAAGAVVGLLVPAAARSILEPRVSEDELRRREQQRGGRPLADILSDLEKRR